MNNSVDHGLSCPVLVPAQPCWTLDYSSITTEQLAALPDEQLAGVDPLAANLIVARGIDSLSDLDLVHYQHQVNSLAEDFRTRYLPYWAPVFQHEPHSFRNDWRFFCVGMISQYLHDEVGIKYIPEQRDLKKIRYLNPSDLFLNGILDTMEGTCANMPAMALAIGWRMGWAVSLACVRGHYVLRYDDGDFTFNIEVTADLPDGFSAPGDHNLIEDYELPPEAVLCGSDVKALTPRERLGVFLSLRARHHRDRTIRYGEFDLLYRVEQDLMLSRYLFPNYRRTHREALSVLGMLGDERFALGEAGNLDNLTTLIGEVREYQYAIRHNATASRNAPAASLQQVREQETQSVDCYFETVMEF